MTESESTRIPHWSKPEWDDLPYAVKAAELQAFLHKVGYGPEKARQEAELRELRHRVSNLEH